MARDELRGVRAIGESVTHTGPGLGRPRRLEAPLSAGIGAIWDALEDVDVIFERTAQTWSVVFAYSA